MFRKPKTKIQLVANAMSIAVLSLFLALECTAQTDAAREAFKESAEFRDAISRTASSVKKYGIRLEKTERSLGRLSRSGGDLKERYRSFAKDIRRLKNAHKKVASDIDKMLAQETEYFTAWDKANMQIADPELRQALAMRRSAVMRSYQDLSADVSAIGRDLQPLMSHLSDLDLFLAADTSQANFKDASTMFDVSRTEMQTLKPRVSAVERILRAFLIENQGPERN